MSAVCFANPMNYLFIVHCAHLLVWRYFRRLCDSVCWTQRALRDPSTLVRQQQTRSCLDKSRPECFHRYNLRHHCGFVLQRQ